MPRHTPFFAHSQARRRVSATLGLEMLEPRLPLAGDVTLTVNNGTLTITGDAQNNEIAVGRFWGRTVVAADSSEGNGQTRIRFGGAVGVAPIGLQGIHSVVIDMRGGGDSVRIGGSQLPALNFRSLTINLGEGGNVLSVANTNIQQNVAVRGGNGSDLIVMRGMSVGGSLSVQGWHGFNHVTMYGVAVMGSLEVVGGLDIDSLMVRSSNASTVRLRAGEGDNFVEAWGIVVNAQLEILTGAGRDTVMVGGIAGPGAFVGHTGAGDDRVFAMDWLPGPRSFSLGLGQGQNEAQLEGLAIDGPLTVTGGVGDDVIEISATDILGRLVINAGAGNNQVTVTQVSALAIDVTTGDGVDQVRIVFGRYAGEVRVVTGAGADDLALLGIESGSIDVDLGDGDDIATLQWNVFGRRTRFDGGRGRDTARFTVAEHEANFFSGFEVFEQLVIRP